MNFCKKCISEFEGKPQVKTGFCPACVDAIKRGKAQTKKMGSKSKAKAKKSEPTSKELLAEAKELGLKNYSKLNKTKLEEVISEAKADKKESGEKAKGKT